MHTYAVCYRSCAVSGAQITKSDPLQDDDAFDTPWEDVPEAEIFIKIIKADSPNGAVMIIADQENCHPNCLVAHLAA